LQELFTEKQTQTTKWLITLLSLILQSGKVKATVESQIQSHHNHRKKKHEFIGQKKPISQSESIQSSKRATKERILCTMQASTKHIHETGKERQKE
jgi:hypothetical protein